MGKRLSLHCEKRLDLVHIQCDQKKSPIDYKKLPKIDFTRKVIDFDTFTKIA